MTNGYGKPTRSKSYYIPYTGSITIDEYDNGDDKPPVSRFCILTVVGHGNGSLSFEMTMPMHKSFDVVVEFFKGIGEEK